MANEVVVLTGVTASVAAIHTLAGPDHYVPFLGMARAGAWPAARTLRITALCGLGHVLGSALLASLGAAALVGGERLLALERLRGGIAAWGLIAFGLAYTAWGLRRAARSRPHQHWHAHPDGSFHQHRHVHEGEHAHVHPPARGRVTPWALFALFALGPCEPLIPLLMYPPVTGRPGVAVWLVAVFTGVTVGTMLIVVAAGLRGMRALRLPFTERYAHALAGAAVLACGLSILLLGL